MSIWAILIVVAITYGIGFGTGWKVDTWKRDSEDKAKLEAAIEARDDARRQRDRVSNNFEKKLANLRIVNRTINNEVRHEVEKTVYGDPNCNLPASGVGLRHAAVDAANRSAAGESVATVPSDPAATDGQAGDTRRPVSSGSRTDPVVR